MDDELIIDVDIPMPPHFPNESDGYAEPPSMSFSQTYQPPSVPFPQTYQPPSVPFPQTYQPPSVPFPQTYQPSSLNIPPSFQSVDIPDIYTPKSNMSYSSHESIIPVNESTHNQVMQYEGTEQESEEAWYTSITKTISDHTVTIHSIADLIFFYMFFKFTRNKYAETQTLIDNTRENIKKIQRQYGLNTKRTKHI